MYTIDNIKISGIIKKRKKEKKKMNIKTFTKSLKPIYIYDHIVHMQNGKAYRVYRCNSDNAVHEYMRSQGFDTKEIVRIDLVTPKK
ncbi:MAG: hypothetical protein EBY16_07420 [Gammaproteobacteria bacterium]|nr:hypothetical protein [Gammaproteobacteria bacterium]